jgi:hypothetical protein
MRGLSTHYLTLGLFLLIPALLLDSCVSPQAVASFAGNAEKTFEDGAVLFGDLHGTCERRHAAAAVVSPIFFPAALRAASEGNPPELPACAAFAREGEDLTKASAVLSDYFRSMQQLASFDSTTVSGPSAQGATSIAGTSGLNYTQVDSVSKLASLLTEAFTERYRQHDLVKILSRADPSIGSLTQAFEDIVAKDYAGLLSEEQRSVAAQYQSVADTKVPATILLLNRAYLDDLNELNRRKATAEAFVQALRQIRDGHHMLAQNAKRLKAKDLTVALQPFTDKLEGLLPVVEKRL